ncbi:MAG: hypothetical protein WAM81_11005 [Acidimicrobiia bacterium]
MSNPDPKPGRWILPLIIIGMVGFTYFFVSSLPTAEPEGTTSTSAVVTTTTSPGTSSSGVTTTTTLPEDVQSYLDTMEQRKADLDLLTQDLLTANANWDDNATSGVTFTDTKAAFQDAIDKAQVLDDSLTTITPPAGYTALASLHADLSTAAAQVLSTTKSALAGLQSSDTGEARTAAIEAFNQAVAEFNSAYEGLVAAATNPS